MFYVRKFFECEDGAVTVDWVVLTAALVGLGVAVTTSIASGATDVSDGVGASLSAAEPPPLDFSSVTPDS